MSAAVNDAGDDEEDEQEPHPWSVVNEDTERPTVEFYETDEGIVLYDPSNPYTWIEVKGEAGHAYVEIEELGRDE